jgi:hypothetical protein
MSFYRDNKCSFGNKIVLFEKEEYAHSIGTSKVGIYTLVEVGIGENNKNEFELCKIS